MGKEGKEATTRFAQPFELLRDTRFKRPVCEPNGHVCTERRGTSTEGHIDLGTGLGVRVGGSGSGGGMAERERNRDRGTAECVREEF